MLLVRGSAAGVRRMEETFVACLLLLCRAYGQEELSSLFRCMACAKRFCCSYIQDGALPLLSVVGREKEDNSMFWAIHVAVWYTLRSKSCVDTAIRTMLYIYIRRRYFMHLLNADGTEIMCKQMVSFRHWL